MVKRHFFKKILIKKKEIEEKMTIYKVEGRKKMKKKFYGLNRDKVFRSVLLNPVKGYNYLFLNRLLSDILEEEIEIIDIKSNDLPISNVKVKYNVVDILCMTKSKELLNIELNSNFGKAVQERNLIYYMNIFTQRYKHNGIKDENIRQINLNFEETLRSEKEEIMITEVRSERVYNEEFKIINVDVEKYKKIWYDKRETGPIEHIEIILLACKTKEELEEISKKGDEVIMEVAKEVIRLNDEVEFTALMSPEEDAKLLSDKSLYYAKQDGIEQGEKNKAIDVAKSLIQKGLSIIDIMDVTKLSEKEVLKIKESIAC